MSKSKKDECSVSVFDLDRTLVHINSSFRYCQYLCRAKVLPRTTFFYSLWCYARFKMGLLSIVELHAQVFKKLMMGLKLSTFSQNVDLFVQKEIAASLYDPAIQCLRSAQDRGDHIVILSSSPDFLVKAVAHFLGVQEWKGTEYAVDKEGKLCHISALMQGDEKARHLHEIQTRMGLDRAQITAYSDSYEDLPFLEKAGTAIAVNPDRRLRKYSKEHRWQII